MIVQEYIREDGSSPFRSWFDDLDSQASAKVATAIIRLELGNLSNVKWIGGGLGEYRIDWGRATGSISPRMEMNSSSFSWAEPRSDSRPISTGQVCC